MCSSWQPSWAANHNMGLFHLDTSTREVIYESGNIRLEKVSYPGLETAFCMKMKLDNGEWRRMSESRWTGRIEAMALYFHKKCAEFRKLKQVKPEWQDDWF